MPDRLRLNNEERSTLAEIRKRLRRKSPEKVAPVAKPETILGWFRKLVLQEVRLLDLSLVSRQAGYQLEIVNLIVGLTRKNSAWVTIALRVR